jgi:hypothetical protein
MGTLDASEIVTFPVKKFLDTETPSTHANLFNRDEITLLSTRAIFSPMNTVAGGWAKTPSTSWATLVSVRLIVTFFTEKIDDHPKRYARPAIKTSEIAIPARFTLMEICRNQRS